MKVLLSARPSVVRFVIAALLVAGVISAALLSSASVAAAGHTGQALALRAALRSGSMRDSLGSSLMAQKPHAATAANRFKLPRNFYQQHPMAGANATTSPVLINEGVQTYDVFAPAPSFLPTNGALTPVNLTPVWTSDGRYIVFSSNRPYTDVNGATISDGSHFHLWAVAASGDTDPTALSLHQITTSSGSEFFPAVYTATNAQLAFVSTAYNGVQNLYAIGSFDAAVTQLVNVNNLTSLTVRNSGGANDLITHFGEVDRPTWSPGGDRLAFSAIDNDGIYGPGPSRTGTHHLWFLYVNSGGATSDSNGPSPTNAPGKLTNGPADDTDPAWTPDSAANIIAFASTAPANTDTTGNSPNGGFQGGTVGNPATSLAGTPGANRSIYAINPDGTLPRTVAVSGQITTGGQITSAGADDFGPAWNPNPAFSTFLTFARGTTQQANHDIDYLTTVYVAGNSSVGNGNTAIAPEGGTNDPLFTINTDDQPARGAPNNPGGIYNKFYPSWSPFLSLEAVVYGSNRSITYNDPTTGSPVENAISLAQGTFGVGTNYMGLLVSRFDDLDPPTFLPYNGSENIHVTNGTDNVPRRNGDITPGTTVQFTVRLSNREAGVDDNNVYVQIKNPNSKYQDSRGVEHKVFTHDVTDAVANPQGFQDPNFGFDSATGQLYNGGAGGAFYSQRPFHSPIFEELGTSANASAVAYAQFFAPLPDVAEAIQTFTVNGNPYQVQERGAVGGNDGGVPISVGIDPGAGSIPSPITITTGSPAVTKALGDGDPAKFQSFGQEYECQYLSPAFGINGATDAVPTDFGTPFYLAGVDDQLPHSGATHQPPMDANGNLEWIQLTRAAQQDALGGVLYTGSLVTPVSPSDYYLDVIAYDKATEPDQPGLTAANWRIYDNIWGFSTQAAPGGKNILVVIDNALGQKFVATTFGGNGVENIPPIFYGAESYYTDIDTSLLPNAIYRYVSESGNMPAFNTDFPNLDDIQVPLDDTRPVPEVVDLQGTGESRGLPSFVFNGLGVSSYTDGTISDPAQVSSFGGVPTPVSQQYSLWRILSRGPVSQQVLNSYLPTFQTQPAVNDPVTQFTGNLGNAAGTDVSVPVANRCVVWVSPYAGDLPLNTVGSIADGNVQDQLRAFVAGGGRLLVSGQSIASTLAQGGASATQNSMGSFLFDVLNASLAPNLGGNQNLSGMTGRISGDGFFNESGAQQQHYLTQETANGFVYAPPTSFPLILGNNYIDFPPIGLPALWRTDGSLDQLGPVLSSFGPVLNPINVVQSQISAINVQNGAFADLSSAGPGFDQQTSKNGPALVYRIYPNEPTASAPADGGRVVFSSIGLEGLGIEYYKFTQNNVDFFFAVNQRPNILHNAVCFLRTATVTGTIFAGNSGGQTLAGATVYLLPNGGTIPGTLSDGTTQVRQTYSAKTIAGGTFAINGVEPGGYSLVAYKTGYQRAASNNAHQVEGDSTTSFSLNLTPVTPGTITGQVKDANGNGIGGAALTFTSSDGTVKVTGVSRADGTYTISGVAPTTYTSVVTAAGYTSATQPDAPTPNPFTVLSGQTTANVNFTLNVIPGTLGGVVKDDFTNQPIPGVKVSIFKSTSVKPIATFTTGTASTPVAGATGDGSPINYSGPLTQGTYSVTITPPANYSNPLPVTGTVTIISNQFTRQDFTLTSDLGQIGGLVNDAGTGKPFAGATVTATDANGTVFPVGTTSGTATAPGPPTGDNAPLNFTGNIPAGTYTITITATNYFTQTFPNTVINVHQFTRVPTGGGAINLVSTLGTLGGLVREFYPNGQGAAIAGATVTVTDANKKIVFGPFTTPSAPTASPNDGGITGDGGNVNYDTLVTLPEGTYTVTASAANFTTTSVVVQITHNKFTRGDVALHSTQGTIGGLITDVNTGKPLGGATVTITTADTNATTVFGPFVTAADGSTTTPPNGRYGDGSPVNFAATITAGTYNVTISKQGAGALTRPDYNTVTFPITVVADQFTRSDKALIYAYGTLGGLIKDSYSQQILAGGTVTVADATGNVVATLSGRNSTTSPAAPIGDGSPLNYSTGLTLYGGTGTVYTVTASATDHTTSAAIKVTVVGSQFKRQDFALVSTMGAVGGLVLDASNGGIVSGATVTISDTTGAVVTTFNTTAATSTSAAPTGDGSPVNYTGPLTQGTYSATVTKRGYNTSAAQSFTITPNHFSRIDFSGATYGLPPVHVFAAGYNFFSVPYDYASVGVGFDQLFGTLNTGTRSAPSAGSNRSHIFVWSPQLVQYVLDPQAPADGLHLGQGYWVYLLNSHEVTVAASATTAKSVTVNLHLGWNQIGVPSLTAISVSNLTFNNPATGGTISFADASGSVYRLVSTPLYGYNGSAYFTVTAGSSLQPWQSYWIYAFADTSVNIPTS